MTGTSPERIPTWLAREERPPAVVDRDPFVDRSILGFLGILSRFRDRGGDDSDRKDGDATIHLLCTLLLVTLVSLSSRPSYLPVVGVYLLVLLALARAEEILRILGTALAAAFFAFLVLVPSVFLGHSHSLVSIPSKVLLSVTAVGLLSASVRWARLTVALKRFFVPDVFILVLDVAIRYIHLLGGHCLELLYALKLRSVGRNPDKRSALAGVAGTLFLESRAMAEEMHAAMTCRGFTGEYRAVGTISPGLPDALRMAALTALAVLYLYLERN